MGMFDYVENVLYCPFCGTKQPPNSFQTKSFVCMMAGIDLHTLKKDESMNCYSSCCNPKCDMWIELVIEGKNDM